MHNLASLGSFGRIAVCPACPSVFTNHGKVSQRVKKRTNGVASRGVPAQECSSSTIVSFRFSSAELELLAADRRNHGPPHLQVIFSYLMWVSNF